MSVGIESRGQSNENGDERLFTANRAVYGLNEPSNYEGILVSDQREVGGGWKDVHYLIFRDQRLNNGHLMHLQDDAKQLEEELLDEGVLLDQAFFVGLTVHSPRDGKSRGRVQIERSEIYDADPMRVRQLLENVGYTF